MDVANGRRLALEQRPYADAFENAPTAVGQCRAAVIEARLLLASTKGLCLDEHHPERQLIQCQREAGTHHAAAANGNVVATRRLTHGVTLMGLTRLMPPASS